MNLFFSMLLMYIVPAIIIACPIWFFGRERVHWLPWGILSLPISFLTWIILASMNLRNKSLSNAGVESLILGIIAGIIQILPVIMPEIDGSRIKSYFVVLLLSIVTATLIYFGLPTFPD